MRQERTVQATLFEVFAGHEIGKELKAISKWLDENIEVVALAARDLLRVGLKPTGRQGLPAEAVLRCAVLKQYRQLSYEELAFHLEDSASFRAFARLPLSLSPKKSVLQKTISAVRAETWEKINNVLLYSATRTKVEDGSVIRIDSTVTSALIHEPSDSSLLSDAVRIMARLLRQADTLAGGCASPWRNHSRAAKKRAHKIKYARGKEARFAIYRQLIPIVRKTLDCLDKAIEIHSSPLKTSIYLWRVSALHYRSLIIKIIDQTERRVLHGESVPAAEKVVSLFEEHTDIIMKGGRGVQYGHKLNLATGRSGLILDLVVEGGNPADSDRLLPMLDRHIDFYGQAPRQAAADGGYASRANLAGAKERGVCDMAFHKKVGLTIEDMVKSQWVYRKLRNFRAGIEAGISCLKRAYGLGRCTWRGLGHFNAYVWSSVVAYNLALFVRLNTG